MNPMTEGRPGSGLSLLDGLICLFLLLPLLLFCAWFKWPFAVGLAALALFGFYKTMEGARLRAFDVSRRALVAICLLALGWTALSGVGHIVYANADWLTRDAVLRDLVATPWPPSYQTDGDFALILRAPIAYYLPAAVVGSLLGLQAADIVLYLWTVAGFVLFVCAATTLFSTPRQRVICCAVLLGFGGLDLLGYVILDGIPKVGQHIEWWASFAQYSSNSTLLFWVPNHALPGWLGTMLLLRHWRKPELARVTPLLFATIPLWAPLPALGLAPFFLFGIDWRRDYKVLFSIQGLLPWLALALVVARYITLDSGAIPRGWAPTYFANVATFCVIYGLFCLLEFGLLALVLAPLRVYDVPLKISIAVLLLLPFYRFGQGNDLVMRASIPALTILALATVRPLAEHVRAGWRYAMIAILVVGAAGAAQEPLRALTSPRWALTGRTLGQISSLDGVHYNGLLPPNYVARLNQPGLMTLLRPPTLVQPYRAAAAPEPAR